MHMITEWMPAFHLPSSHRILYVGRNLTLLKFLQDELEDCSVVYCPGGSIARTLIKGVKYSLLLFDNTLPDATGAELERFAWAHRARTPTIVLKDSPDFDSLAQAIKQRLRRTIAPPAA